MKCGDSGIQSRSVNETRRQSISQFVAVGFLLLRCREGCGVLWWVCLFVCLSACTTRKLHTKFLCMLLVAMARSSSDGVAIRQVLPVLWMTSRFPSMGPVGQNSAWRYISIKFTRWRHQLDVRQLVFGWVYQNAAPGATSVIYDSLLFNKLHGIWFACAAIAGAIGHCKTEICKIFRKVVQRYV